MQVRDGLDLVSSEYVNYMNLNEYIMLLYVLYNVNKHNVEVGDECPWKIRRHARKHLTVDNPVNGSMQLDLGGSY